jgi:hypothetical protein
MSIDTFSGIKFAAGILAGLSLMSGLLAAYFWYRSAASGLNSGQIRALLEGDESHERLADWLAEGANYNKWAAIWTAVSVVPRVCAPRWITWPRRIATCTARPRDFQGEVMADQPFVCLESVAAAWVAPSGPGSRRR